MIEDKNLRSVSNQREEIFLAENYRPLIPDGIYQVQCFRIERGTSQPKTLKMFLYCRIIDGKYSGTELFMALNLMDHTGKPFKKVPVGSKYNEQWIIANRNKLPSRQDRMSSSIFMNGIFEAEVRTVRPRFANRKEKPSCFHYSVIDHFTNRMA